MTQKTKINGHWVIPENLDISNFDFTWRPDPDEGLYIHEFGTQWQKTGGPRFVVEGATQKKYRSEQKAIHLPTPEKFVVAEYLEIEFDFSWHPDSTETPYIYIWGNPRTPGSTSATIKYITANATQAKYVHDNVKVLTHCDMFYVITNESNTLRFEELQLRYPHLQKTRFVNNWIDTINRCAKKSTTALFWILSSDLDYSNYNFDFYPQPWEMNMLHIFSTQWSHWGKTYLVNATVFTKESQNVKNLYEIPNINHLTAKDILARDCIHDILYIDHGNSNAVALDKLNTIGKVTSVKFDSSYLTVLKKWIAQNASLTLRSNYWIWVTNSICDYSDFDFSWHCDPYQTKFLHAFSCSFCGIKQKFGDTFLINISELIKEIANLNTLESYSAGVNYIDITVPRLQHPVIKHKHDSQIQALNQCSEYSYYEIVDESNVQLITTPTPLNLWNDNTSIVVKSTGASHILIPNTAVEIYKQELYDYSYITKDISIEKSRPLDIIFLSNGEPGAQENYNRLLELADSKKLDNRIVRIQDVNGRVASQQTAAIASNTNWYFLINAKIYLNDTFDWSWQPDRLQQPKHYIFTVTNPVNDLVYGHQAIVANNRNLTLQTIPKGLDFTMDSLHSVVDMNCGTAIYNTDIWTTWRTAFREAIKLRWINNKESLDRLDRWCTIGRGNYGEWSIKGAQDGVQYWERVSGNLSDLMLSYDWEWIKQYFEMKYDRDSENCVV